MSTGWTRPNQCAATACVEYREVPGGVEISATDTEMALFATTEEWDAFVTGLRSDLAAENARLRQRAERAEALARLVQDSRDRLQARLNTADAHVEELRGQRDEARVGVNRLAVEAANLQLERDAMRPVVEAADAWLAMLDRLRNRSACNRPTERGLIGAVGAWRAAQPDDTPGALVPGEGDVVEEPAAQPNQKAPETALRATQADERGADDGAGTEGLRAQGGVQGGPWSDSPEDIDAARPHLVEPAPADPAGLDAAIEAAIRAAAEMDCDRFDYDHGSDHEASARHREYDVKSTIDDPQFRGPVIAAVRAAAPHLRAAALNEAADDFDEFADSLIGSDIHEGVWTVAVMLRERAGRIGGGE